MEQYTMDNLTWETNKTCATSDEELRHYDFYNLNTPGNSREGTHPNYRGYNRMAQGVQKVVEYLLFNGAKPTYMIDIR
jgi:lysophospholipase L1-like esterase